MINLDRMKEEISFSIDILETCERHGVKLEYDDYDGYRFTKEVSVNGKYYPEILDQDQLKELGDSLFRDSIEIVENPPRPGVFMYHRDVVYHIEYDLPSDKYFVHARAWNKEKKMAETRTKEVRLEDLI